MDEANGVWSSESFIVEERLCRLIISTARVHEPRLNNSPLLGPRPTDLATVQLGEPFEIEHQDGVFWIQRHEGGPAVFVERVEVSPN